jgi:hypothetical protein
MLYIPIPLPLVVDLFVYPHIVPPERGRFNMEGVFFPPVAETFGKSLNTITIF